MMAHRVFTIIFLLLIVTDINCTDIEVEIPLGILRGDTRINADGGTYYAFKNVPYAKPPVGELRFKAPEPAESWEGVRDATQEMSQCRQSSRGGGIVGSEDCLYLNIYTPSLSDANSTQKTVMVFVHGGGFSGGGGLESTYGGKLLLTKDVVLVTINYRLGIFGFISLDDSNLGLTGNAALKDQATALKWIQVNVEYFGGNPNNVLLFGESAGAMCVHHHLMSPFSAGLFHKAISQSGTSFTPDAMGYIRNSAIVVAEYLGVQTDDWEEMLKSLQELSTDEIFAAQTGVVADYSYIFRPIVEIESNQPRFMERRPIDVITTGEFNQVPYLNGINNLEGLGVKSPIEDLTKYIFPDLQIQSGSDAEQDIVRRIKDFYYDGEETAGDDIMRDIQLDTDFQFLYGHYRAVTGQVKSATQPIYFYYFSVDTELNRKNSDPSNAEFQGAAHTDELGYLLHNDELPEPEAGSVADLAWRNMVEMWTNFAKDGNPTPEGFAYKWEPFREDQYNYLHIDTEGSTPNVYLLQENMDFWNSIYEDYYTK